MLVVRVLCLLSLAALGACAPPGEPEPQTTGGGITEGEAGLIASGRQIALAHCADCHAVERGGQSPLPNAPPLEELRKRYDLDTLADHLIEGIRVGHDEMPAFDLDIRTTDALLAYIKSLAS